MNIPVHMFAFASEGDRSQIRYVDIPDEELTSTKDIKSILELVFKYGQNDFQRQPYPSVSVGDIAEVNGRFFMVLGSGWGEMTKEEFDNVPVPSSYSAYKLSFKKAALEDE